MVQDLNSRIIRLNYIYISLIKLADKGDAVFILDKQSQEVCLNQLLNKDFYEELQNDLKEMYSDSAVNPIWTRGLSTPVFQIR